MYADLDFWLALLKDDDWLADRAESLLDEHEVDLEVSLATFIELSSSKSGLDSTANVP